MEKHTIKGANSSGDIFIGMSKEEVSSLLGDRNVIVLTDEHLNLLYPLFLDGTPRIVVPATEASKSLSQYEAVMNQLLELGADRSTFLLGFGGGMVSDLCGFVASTYMRGLDFGYVPTSLLAQVDASIGGKTGINLSSFKNMIGTFNQPEFVLIDPSVLQTLPEEDLRDGCAEAIKHFAIKSAEDFKWMQTNAEQILAKDPDLLAELVRRAAPIKIKIVQQDVLEKGDRKLLNFGHSYGHAIEAAGGKSHGVCVAQGMLLAGRASKEIGSLSESDYQRLYDLISAFGFDTEEKYLAADLIGAIKKDKKKQGDTLAFIVLNKIGDASIKSITFDALAQVDIS